jgi:hypothetical protein
MKILLITDSQCPPSVKYYRTEGVIGHFPDDITIDKRSVQECLSDDSWAWGRYQAIWLQQYHRPEYYSIVQKAHQYNIKVILDDDDLRINTPLHNPASRYYADQTNKKRIIDMHNMADLLFVSTPHLKKQYKSISNAPIVVAKNAWAGHCQALNQNKDNVKTNIVWRGSNKHNYDLESVRQPLSKAYNNQLINWVFMGSTPGYLTPQYKEQAPFLPISDYFNSIRLLPIHYFFVPLVIDDFNKCKSNCSAIEALMIAGAAVIAPYGLPEFQHPGVLHYRNNDDLNDLFTHIGKKSITESERLKMVAEGQEWIRNNQSLEVENTVRELAIRQMFDIKA